MADARIEIVQGGFASAYAATIGKPIFMSGCLYRSDGTKVALSERASGYSGDHICNMNPDWQVRPTSAPILPGRGLYLGNYIAHYGHFVSETLSTFWVFEERSAQDFDYFLFHPFIFGTSLPGFARFCFERFGIDPKRIVFADATVCLLEEITVPQRLLELNRWADPRLRWVYRKITAGIPRSVSPTRRIYLSRRRMSARKLNRAVLNEVQIEVLFQQHGFEILYPESASFPEQLTAYANAAILAGLSGSALHNSLFLPKGALVIELGDPRYGGKPAPNQALCNHISGVRNAFIPFRGRLFGARRTMLFDMAYLTDQLRQALAVHLTADEALCIRSPMPVQGFGEIGYLGLRCAIGECLDLVRRLLRRK